MSSKHAVILGARGVIAPYLLERLLRARYTVDCFSRADPSDDSSRRRGVRWFSGDLSALGERFCRSEAIVVSLLPLWLLPPLLPRLSATRQIIAFGSTSVFTKADSADRRERDLAHRLQAAERNLAAQCEGRGIPWTLLRPTLIYGGGRDRELGGMAAFIRRFGVFLIAAPAKGLRQPVHADDLAAAAMATLENDTARNTALDLPGGQTLTYLEMVRRAFQAVGRSPVIIPLPESALGAAVDSCRRMGLTTYGSEMVRRMNRDLVFDDSRARAILDYAPRPFEFGHLSSNRKEIP